MKKSILKFFNKLFNKPIVKFFAYAAIIIGIFAVYGVFDGEENALSEIVGRILAILTSEETLSVFLAGFLSICLSKIIRVCDTYLEESYKVEDDHHSIIRKYKGHDKTPVSQSSNFESKSGVFMSLSHLSPFKKGDVKNKVKDKLSNTYFVQQKEIELYKNGTLYLPTLNVFANIEGNTDMVFNDKDQLFPMMDYVVENAQKLLSAHKHSRKNNSSTIRLNDFSFENNTLTLDTQRSMYYHMLITNRCMDYEISDGLTIRNIYEYKRYISLLRDSTLSNQIGINGLIITSDGYVLVEKRDHRKITWKNKFAQSISLALKEEDLGLKNGTVIGNTPNDAEAIIKNVIEKTVRSNFGLLPDEYETFTVNNNFLGLARDLLEGGKPNLYFYLTTVYTARQLKSRLEKNARATDPDMLISRSKLASDYYLIAFDELAFTYDYFMTVNRRRSLWIYRRIFPRSTLFAHIGERIKHGFKSLVHPKFSRECGEALLVTVSYLELCRHRIPALNKEEKNNG